MWPSWRTPCRRSLRAREASRESVVKRTYVVPGRIELVGKHVDYAGGRSLTCAVDLAITARAKPLDRPVVRVTVSDRRGQVELPLVATAEPSGPPWSSYVAAVVRRFAR